MKLIQKGLLFVSLLSVGTTFISLPSNIGNTVVQAASVKSKDNKSNKNLNPNNVFYRIGKDEFIKAKDVKMTTKDDENSEDNSLLNSDFLIKVNTHKAVLYNKNGEKLDKCSTRGTIYDLGNQNSFNSNTFYNGEKKQLVELG